MHEGVLLPVKDIILTLLVGVVFFKQKPAAAMADVALIVVSQERAGKYAKKRPRYDAKAGAGVTFWNILRYSLES